MDKIILYVDDAAYAVEHLDQLAPAAPGRHWIVVACAPRMTHRISKWVSHSARENWRAKWFARVQEALAPLLAREGAQATAVLAKGPLVELTQRLHLEHGAARVVDARRPRIGSTMEPLVPAAAEPAPRRPLVPGARALPGGLAGLAAFLLLAPGLAD
ncbi:hypothetical protein DFR41_101677 [Pseudacidovorax intermedius]|uniref:Universal stress protein family protein n=2 Tax=Pseudacidovorax intermedius TaxID=433924 RepID=A0A370FPX1_9BURK|nr:hypothetical protein [Pseudacidovorax intermedius]RDI28921.1 hypothetical protein DFR41_101677 [Pseudacidovorax intermedius]